MAGDSEVLIQPMFGGYDPDTYQQLHDVEPQPVLQDYASACPVRMLPTGELSYLGMSGIREIAQHDSSRSIPATDELLTSLGNERPLIPLQIDGDRHRDFRRILDPLFSPRKVAALEPAVRALANELIDSFVEGGSVDAYAEFCAILPATVFVRLMGIPESDIPHFMSFKNDLLRTDPSEGPEEAQARFVAAGKRCYGYFSQLLTEREASAEEHDDLIAWFMSAEVDGQRLTREDILDITYLLMIAGLDTVAASLSCFLSWLARHPEERQNIVAHPDMWPKVVEELLRFETPVPNTVRFAADDMEVDGRLIPKGTAIHLSWAAANLDPEAFPEPLTVNFDRPRSPHVTFASGAHRCLGSHLARMELVTALDAFHQRIPDYGITTGAKLKYEAFPVRLVSPLPLSWPTATS
jgi:cytochrome P450